MSSPEITLSQCAKRPGQIGGIEDIDCLGGISQLSGSLAQAPVIFSPLHCCWLTAIPVDCVFYKEGIGSLLALAISVPFPLSDLGLQLLMGAPIYTLISEVSPSGKFLPLTFLCSRNFSDGEKEGVLEPLGMRAMLCDWKESSIPG